MFLQRERLAVAALSMVLLLSYVLWENRPSSQPEALPVAATPPSTPENTASIIAVSAIASSPAPIAQCAADADTDTILQRAHSLRGAALPDGLQVDEQGELVTGLQLKLLFDFLLAARHDVGDAELDEWLQGLAESLPERAATQALQRWQDYRQYQQELAALIRTHKPAAPAGPLSADQIQAIESLFNQREQLQQHWLGDLAQPWFGDDNAYDRRMLARAQSSQPVVEPPILAEADSHPLQAAYERQRDALLQSQALAPDDQAQALEQLRREYFPERQAYLRQTLNDLSRSIP